ncbi:DUF5082 family protein [Sporosarcina sp.]|uniref:YwqH-like family protein n=1 Tax=Sporosarcina sp. TaxID=49982 RepID=UPI00262B9443|nr:DUF5082 family protein [Sporosarcina sp.]
MLFYYYALKAKKQRDVERLNACQGELQTIQSEFTDNAWKCLDPELTTMTWQGKHANDFEDIRNSGIHSPYLEITGEQFEKVFNAIMTKITELIAEIASIQQTIDRLLAEMEARK